MPQSEVRFGLAPAALEGFRNAAAYDAHRPSYPPEAVDALLEKMRLLSRDVNMVGGIGSGSGSSTNNDDEKQDVARIVEIAAGTGKFTEALVAAAGRSSRRRRRHYHQSLLLSSSSSRRGGGDGEEEEEEEEGGGGGEEEEEEISGREWGGRRDLGLEILATEPHPDMLRELEGKRLPGVLVRRAGAEEIGRVVVVLGEEGEGEGEGWADGVVAAQAFHWFATDQVLGEIHRILKPGGVFGMIWNIDDYNKPKSWKASTRWAQHLNNWILSLSSHDDNKRFRDMAWQDVFTRQLKTNPFSALASVATHDLPNFSVPLGEDAVAWTHWLSEEALWRRIQTLSHVALLEGAGKEEGEAVFREAMAMGDVVRNEEGEVECHGRTYFAWTDRV